ncbi:hypothetical protein BGW41_003395 [Actinomortierella wolfii]|nr:hypothetical protein BGW41_003395 [Actinomortierella wolfii]
MIKSVLIFNNHGNPRLTKFYQSIDIATQQALIKEIFHLISKRPDTVCNFLEGSQLLGGQDTRVIYRHYATLYFVFVVDESESELGILDLIQVFVEALDRCFENVCELDLPPQPVHSVPNTVATAVQENSEAKTVPDGKKRMRRILRRPQPLNLDHSKLVRHSSLAPNDQVQAITPMASSEVPATSDTGGHPAGTNGVAHITIDIPPPSASVKLGGPKSARTDARSIPRASSIDNSNKPLRTTNATATSPWQTGIQRRLAKIQRRKRPPNLFSWYSRQVTRGFLFGDDEAYLTMADSGNKERTNATTIGTTFEMGTAEIPHIDRNSYSPFVPSPSAAASTTPTALPRIPAWASQPSNTSAPEFYSDEAVDLLLHLRDYLIEAVSKGWNALELRESILPLYVPI